MQNKKKILPKNYNFLRPKQTNNLARFGIKRDGGYIIEKTVLENVNHLISFGMADEFSFELDFLSHNKLNTLQIYDHTVNHKKYLFDILKIFRRVITFRKNFKHLNNAVLKYYFFLKFIFNKKVKFLPLKITSQAKDKKEIDIDNVFLNIDKSINNIGIKIDIEGDEYIIIDKILENCKKINFLIIEFHKIDQNNQIFLNFTNKLTNAFDVIHIHGNNHEHVLPDGFPNAVEISFVNKNNNLSFTNYPSTFPIKGLDYPNNPMLPEIEINFE